MEHQEIFDILRASVMEWDCDNPIEVKDLFGELCVTSFASTPMIKDWTTELDMCYLSVFSSGKINGLVVR
jgi:hypothetical protein